MKTLVLLRGNSGSGKTTVAKLLQDNYVGRALLISQDVVRREMLRVKDTPGNQAIGLLQLLVEYGSRSREITILEGILYTELYGELFRTVRECFGSRVFAYYFDISFEETLSRHSQRSLAGEFGESEMRRWWREKDCLSDIPEQIVTAGQSAEETVARIVRDIETGYTGR
ncbi:MAG: AAA family ATPase [Oscillospiraceae bacterium]